MKPVMEPSRFSFQFTIVGTPAGALFDSAFFTTGGDLVTGAVGPLSDCVPPPDPKRENVDWAGAFLGAESGEGALDPPPPKRLMVDRAGAFSTFFFAAAAAAARFSCNAAAAAALFSSASFLLCSAASAAAAFFSSATWRLASAAAAAAAFLSSTWRLRAAAASSAAAFLAAAASEALLFCESTGVFGAGSDLAGVLLGPPPKRPKIPPPAPEGAAEDSSKKYLDPDPVVTTAPPTASDVIGEVVTGSPSSNEREPEMKPEIEPSRFCLHRERVGTPAGAFAAFFGATVGTTAAAGATSSDLGTPNPNKEIVVRGLADSRVSLAVGAFLAAAS
mmetsp:Transcript_43948/g.133880  ORF Transcript_43948/g.133880 Transcript_43948/m.133880 type:complete len:333 (-) Transcript_43948:252-1250(-)